MSFAGHRRKSSKSTAVACLGVIGALLCLLPRTRAERLDDLAPWSYVSDFANALSHGSREQLTKMCVEFDDRTQAQIAIVTVHSLDGAALDPYAAEMYSRWGIGYPPANRGVLVLVVTNDRKHKVVVGSGLTSILTPSKLATFDQVTDSMLAQGDFDNATLYLSGEVARAVGAASHVALASQPNVQLSKPATGLGSPVTLAVGGLVVLLALGLGVLFVSRGASRRRLVQPARSAPAQVPGASSGRDSGGFGGAGGFGGFGGNVSSGGASGGS